RTSCHLGLVANLSLQDPGWPPVEGWDRETQDRWPQSPRRCWIERRPEPASHPPPGPSPRVMSRRRSTPADAPPHGPSVPLQEATCQRTTPSDGPQLPPTTPGLGQEPPARGGTNGLLNPVGGHLLHSGA